MTRQDYFIYQEFSEPFQTDAAAATLPYFPKVWQELPRAVGWSAALMMTLAGPVEPPTVPEVPNVAALAQQADIDRTPPVAYPHAFYTAPVEPPEVPFLGWYTELSDFTRTVRPTTPEQFVINVEPIPQPTTPEMTGWFVDLSEPVRVVQPLTHEQFAINVDPIPPPPVPDVSTWYRDLDERVRTIQPLTHEQFTLNVLPIPQPAPGPAPDMPFGEPVLPLQGPLDIAWMLPLVVDPPIIPPTVTVSDEILRVRFSSEFLVMPGQATGDIIDRGGSDSWR